MRVTTLARAVHDIEADKDQVVIVVDDTGRALKASDLHVMAGRGPGPEGGSRDWDHAKHWSGFLSK